METLQKWVNSIAVCCEKHHLQGGKAKLTYDAEAQLCLLQMSQLFLLTQLSFVVCVDVRVHDTEAWTLTQQICLTILSGENPRLRPYLCPIPQGVHLVA